LLKATPQELRDFINRALAGNGATWSDDGGQHFFSDAEYAAMSESAAAGMGASTWSGSYYTSNKDGTGKGISWGKYEVPLL